MANVENFLLKSGIAHHFEENGIFGHVNLKKEIHSLLQLNEEHLLHSEESLELYEINVQECLDHLQGEQVDERAILDLFKLIKFQGVSQNAIIKNVIKYQKLINSKKEEIIDNDGQCAGIVLAYIAGEIDKQCESKTFNPQLHEFEQSLSRIARWDGKQPIDEQLEKDMTFFINTVCKLQDKQNNPYSLLQTLTNNGNIGSNLSLSWVFNKNTLAFFLEKIAKDQSQYIYIGADKHASMIYPLSATQILYFNPNQQFGAMKLNVDDTFFELFCGGLDTGHSNTHIDRMPISLRIISSSQHVIDLRPMIDELIDISIKNNPNLNSVEKTIAAKNIVNRQASNLRTALMEAALYGNLAEVKLLLNEYHADPGLNDIDGKNALYYAMACGYDECTLEILNHAENIQLNKKFDGMTYLHQALCLKKHAIAKKILLLEDVKLNLQSTNQHFNGFTPLHFAIWAGYEDICSALINNPRVLLNTPEYQKGMTPLHFAVIYNQPKILKLLLEKNQLEIKKCSEEKDEHYPNGFNAFVYLAKEFAYLESEENTSLYADQLVVLANLYEQLLEAGFQLSDLTSQDQLTILYQLTFLDKNYAIEIQKNIRSGLIKLDSEDDKSIMIAEQLITQDIMPIDEKDVQLIQFYLKNASEINLKSIAKHFSEHPQIISLLSDSEQERLTHLSLIEDNRDFFILLIDINPTLLQKAFIEDEENKEKITPLQYLIDNKREKTLKKVYSKHMELQELTETNEKSKHPNQKKVKSVDESKTLDSLDQFTPNPEAQLLTHHGIFKENKSSCTPSISFPLKALLLLSIGAVTLYNQCPTLFHSFLGNSSFGFDNAHNNTLK